MVVRHEFRYCRSCFGMIKKNSMKRNDIFRSLKYSNCVLFADDTTIYIVGENLKFSKNEVTV